MQKTCLILGNGRAGKRHTKYAEKYGLAVHTYDPFDETATYQDERDIPYFYYDYAVIASPPDQHVQQLQILMDEKMRIMCEKPLCSINETSYHDLPNYNNLMLAYNWYYNPQLQSIRGSATTYNLFAEQSRILPIWGIENDHLPHDVFIIDMLSGGITDIGEVNLIKKDDFQQVYVEGKTKVGTFVITERVLVQDTERITRINGTDIVPDPIMFDVMWQAFLSRNYIPSFQDGIHIQDVLHDIYTRIETK